MKHNKNNNKNILKLKLFKNMFRYHLDYLYEKI